MRLKKYRIVKDKYCGYESQVWRIWFPFWVQIGGTNTHVTEDDAEKYIRNTVNSGKVVKYVDI